MIHFTTQMNRYTLMTRTVLNKYIELFNDALNTFLLTFISVSELFNDKLNTFLTYQHQKIFLEKQIYVCMYMYVCNVCICVYVCVYVFMYISMYVCMHVCMYMYICVCMCVYICVSMSLCVCLYVCVSVFINICLCLSVFSLFPSTFCLLISTALWKIYITTLPEQDQQSLTSSCFHDNNKNLLKILYTWLDLDNVTSTLAFVFHCFRKQLFNVISRVSSRLMHFKINQQAATVLCNVCPATCFERCLMGSG